MSAVVYAGAGQFIGVGLLTAGSGFPEIGLVTLLVNARHMVYGLSLIDKFERTGPYKPYLIFALTDETYALLTTISVPENTEEKTFYFLLSLLNHSYWLTATMIGFFAGRLIPFNTEGLDFALTALFVVLLIEQAKAHRRRLPFVIAFAVSVAAALLLGPGNMLIISLVSSIVILILVRGRIDSGPG
jgi:4-azaleucine resistance transporter AzlC